MKYAILSDIHSNPAALEAVLKDASAKGAQKIISLGDVSGYGPDGATAFELARARIDVNLLGNHDAACAGLEDEEYVEANPNYDRDREIREEVGEEGTRWLAERPLVYEGEGFACAHGDFTDPDAFNYVGSPESAEPSFRARPEPLLFVGHTHELAVFTCGPDGRVVQGVDGKRVGDGMFRIEDGTRYLVNVGSVGCPRNDLMSTYALYDTETRTVELRALPFDFKGYIAAFRARSLDLPYWIMQVLVAAMEKGGRRP